MITEAVDIYDKWAVFNALCLTVGYLSVLASVGVVSLIVVGGIWSDFQDLCSEAYASFKSRSRRFDGPERMRD